MKPYYQGAGMCPRGLMASTIVAALICAPAAVAGPVRVFYVDNDIHRVSSQVLDGSAPTPLANTPQALLGLDVDENARKVYWSANGRSTDPTSRGRIFRSDFDGSALETFYTAPGPLNTESVGQIQVDETNGYIYWSDSAGELIRRMNLDGSNQTIVASVSGHSDSLELDRVNGHLYFSSGTFGAGTSKIERINVDGTNRTVIANTYAHSLALDPVLQKIYAADWFGQRLMQLDYDGSGLTELAKTPAIRDVQVFGGMLYYPNIRSETPNNLGPYHFQWVKANLDGSNPTVLYEIPRQQGPSDLIQFAVVPEPSAFAMAGVGFVGLLLAVARRRLRWHDGREAQVAATVAPVPPGHLSVAARSNCVWLGCLAGASAGRVAWTTT